MFRIFGVAVLYLVLLKPNVFGQTNSDFVNALQRGRSEYAAGHLSVAEAQFAAALRTLQPGEDVPRATALAELGDVYLVKDELSKAVQSYSESLAIYRRLSNKKGMAVDLRNLGAAYSLQRRHDDALRVLKEALKYSQPVDVDKAAIAAQVLNSLGVAYYRMAKNNKAEDYFNQAVKVISTFKVPFDEAQLFNNLGAVYFEKHNYPKAEDYMNRALALTEARLGSDHPDLIFTLSALGVLYTGVGRYDDAIARFQRALKIVEPRAEDFDTRIARLLHGMATAQRKAGRLNEASDTLAKATIIARQNLEPHPDMVVIIEDYSAMLKTQGKQKEAEELRAEARRVRVRSSLVINTHN